MTPHEAVKAHMPGWRLSCDRSCGEPGGVFVEVERFNPVRRVMEWRDVWISDSGEVSHASVGSGGDIVLEGAFFDTHLPCHRCGRLTRTTTAGCDHCALDDK